MEQNWQEIKRKLQSCLSRGQYDLWVSSIEFLGLENETAALGCKNRFHIEWVREKLEAKLLGAVQEFFPLVRRLEYQIVSGAPDPDELEGYALRSEPPKQIVMSDLIKRAGPVFNPRFTFDQFVVGSSNQLAFATARGMARGQQLYNNSAYILSETGLGKSHLSHAVGSLYLPESARIEGSLRNGGAVRKRDDLFTEEREALKTSKQSFAASVTYCCSKK